MFTPEQVKKLGHMARIELRDDELADLASDLSSILDYVEELKEVDTEGLEIVSSVTGLSNIFRDDTPEVCDFAPQLVTEAPESSQGYYKVKAVF